VLLADYPSIQEGKNGATAVKTFAGGEEVDGQRP
jgi:hypothetical protein